MKRLMLIGQSQCGKTSLLQRLQQQPLQYHKTQALDYSAQAIDTPGEYLEHRAMYSILITSACDSDIIALVQAADSSQTFFAPMFAAAFTKPVIGIVTKADTLIHNNNLAFATAQLQQAGVTHVFVTSALTEDGITDLLNYLNAS